MLKNIIIITDSAEINGGGAKVAVISAIGLSQKGYNVFMFCGKSPSSSELENAGVKIICTYQNDILNEPSRIKAAIQGLWNYKAYKMLDSLLNNYSPKDTIIHVHIWCKVLSHSIFIPIHKNKFKVILTLHDYFTECANGGLFNYKKKAICDVCPGSISCLLRNCDSRNYRQKVYRFIRLKIQELCLHRKSIVAITLGQYSENVFKSIGTLGKFKNVCRIPNPINIRKKYVYDPSVEVDKYLFIGRLEEDKGIVVFCEAINRLGLKGKVLGSGYMLDYCKKRYPNIEFPGWVNTDDIVKYIQDAKALVVSTLWHETFGLVTLEMKSFGIPSIVPDMHASSDFVKDGFDGFIYKSGDVDSLMYAINRMEKTDWDTMRRNTMASYDENEYSEYMYINRLIKIYNQELA